MLCMSVPHLRDNLIIRIEIVKRDKFVRVKQGE